MKNFLKVMLFSLLTIGFFAGFSNFGIPPIEPAPPPTEEKLDLGSMTMEQFIALGERIIAGKGTCTLCHNELGRAPMLEKVITATPERLADPRYKGEATDLESYLIESMVKPSAYVVAGFGKAGSSDAESPMPDVTGGSIGMSDAEIKAVIAYLQDLGGAEVTVQIPTGAEAEDAQAQTSDGAAAPAQPAVVLNTPEEIVAKGICGACHKMPGQVGAVGPDLSRIGATRDREYLRRSILDPNAEVAEGFVPGMMPPDYGEKLYAKELEILVNYLAGLK